MHSPANLHSAGIHRHTRTLAWTFHSSIYRFHANSYIPLFRVKVLFILSYFKPLLKFGHHCSHYHPWLIWPIHPMSGTGLYVDKTFPSLTVVQNRGPYRCTAVWLGLSVNWAVLPPSPFYLSIGSSFWGHWAFAFNCINRKSTLVHSADALIICEMCCLTPSHTLTRTQDHKSPQSVSDHYE